VSAAISAVAAAAGSAKRELTVTAPQAFAAASEAVSDAVSDAAEAAPAGKKGKGKKGGLLLLFGIGAAAAAAVAVVMSRKPKDDPWAAPVSETAYLPPTSGRGSSVEPVADQAEAAAVDTAPAHASAPMDDAVAAVAPTEAVDEAMGDVEADAQWAAESVESVDEAEADKAGADDEAGSDEAQAVNAGADEAAEAAKQPTDEDESAD
jgi:hypothetical protein